MVRNGTTFINVGGNQISNSILIPANTIADGDTIRMGILNERISGVAGNIQSRIFINTSISLTGASQLATGNTVGLTVNAVGGCSRNFTYYLNNNIYCIAPSSSLATDNAATVNPAIVAIPFDPTIDNYLLGVISNNVSGDSSRTSHLWVEIVKNS